MSEPANQSASASSATGNPVASGAAPRTQRGPETVINPERRAAALPPGDTSSSAGSSVKSSIVRVLFPPESEDGPAHAFDAQHGVQLGHFSIIERIRSGGMGAVFRALDSRLNRVVALKVLPPAMSRDPLIVQRFLNEAQAAAQLDHENIARVHFVGEDHGLHFIAFEFVIGTNIRDLIQQQGRLSIGDAVNFTLQIASALVHTSAQGVIHRDIKPSNIIVTPGGRAKLVDLGLARKENKDDHAADLTIAGTTLGTFDYISPEQARDPRAADIRSDIYSLGCTLYHMLTGEPPFPEGTVLQKLLQHQGDEAPDPAIKNRQVPDNLSVVVRKMMAKDPRRRYQTAEQLVRDLMLVAGALGLRSVSPEGLVWLSSQPERASFWERHLAWMATVAALLLIVGYMEFGGYRYTAQPREGLSAQMGDEARGENSPQGVADRGNGRGTPDDQDDGKSTPKRTESTVGNSKPTKPSGNSQFETEDTSSDAGPNSVKPEQATRADGSVEPFLLTDGLRTGVAGGVSLGPQFDSAVSALGPAKPSSVDNALGPSVVSLSSGEADAAESGNAKPGVETPAVSTSGKTTTPARTQDREPNVTSVEETGVYLLGRDGGPDTRFASLEAACSEIRKDGAVIELRYDGKRRESVLRITKKITIRGAKGYRPAVEFRPSQLISDYQVRAIAIPTGSLELVGVDVSLVVDETVPAEQWSLFSLERPDALKLQGVTATVVNPRMRPAAFVEMRPGATAMMQDMPMVGTQSRTPLEIEITDSLIRGDADLFFVKHAEPARLAVKQSAVAVQGSLLFDRGHTELPNENAQLELRLEHVTAVLGGGLVRFDSGMQPRRVLPVQVTSSNCIYSNTSSGALVTMSGNAPPQDFRGLLSWVGQSNFYDRFQTFWAISSTESMGRSDAWDYVAWKNNWTEAAEANPRLDAVVWKKRQWANKPLAELIPSDFALDRESANNAAVSGATNFTDVGANLAGLPKSPVIDEQDGE